MGLPESILLIVFSLIFFCEETNARISAESNSNSAARFSAATEFYNATHSHQKQLLNFPPQLELLNHPPESPPAAAECPSGCACAQLTVICTGRRLTKVPSNIPPNAVRLDLQDNQISRIRAADFAGLKNLRILNFMDNKIELIEPGAFDDLSSLERLRLNRNRIRHIPDHLFSKVSKLSRLDLSDNSLVSLSDEQLAGPREMTTIQLHRNQLSCLEHRTLSGWSQTLEVLTINGNNLNTFGELPIKNMRNLRMLRLAENPWHCDCRIRWFKRSTKRLGRGVKCHRPAMLLGRNVESIATSVMKCSGMEKRAASSCQSGSTCPSACFCSESPSKNGTTVDCQDRGLRHLPTNLPTDTVELRLERNAIQSIPNNAFQNLNRLIRLDLSNNQIKEIAQNAFNGLTSLNTLMLFSNNLTDLPIGIFSPLENLQILLLNTNHLRCLRSGVFTRLGRLQLLSLYDNHIQAIANGTFSPFESSLQTLHLAKNPLICDCNMEWFGKFLWMRDDGKFHRPIETSGARCHAPRRMSKKRIYSITPEKFRCKNVEYFVTKDAGNCFIDHDCPKNCSCYENKLGGVVVDCSGKMLSHPPKNIPTFANTLMLQNNRIAKIGRGQLSGFPNLQAIDLRDNLIESIDDDAFDGNDQLDKIDLGGNRLTSLGSEIFGSTTKSLRNLLLERNFLKCITHYAFANMTGLEKVSLKKNQIRNIDEGAIGLLQKLSRIDLSANPVVCNCHLLGLLKSLKEGNIEATLNETFCDSPTRLQGRSLNSLDPKELICEIGFEAQRACSSEDGGNCPRGCLCSGTSVRCSRSKLEDIPEGISEGTTELFLDGNKIKHLTFRNLTKLKKLDLSHNHIVRILPGTFSSMSKLSTLVLSYNQIMCIEPGAFEGLNQLRILSLHGNEIAQIPEPVLAPVVGHLTHIAIGSNPLWCDCQMNWLSKWVKGRFVEPGIARCEGPESVRNQLILTARMFDCHPEGPPKNVLAKCDACLESPCQNGGSCQSPRGECICPVGFHGPVCQHQIDACFGDPCQNGGTCELIQEGRFRCRCMLGFAGERCEINVDDCIENKCQNGGKCIDQVNGYRCECPPLYGGRFCHQRLQFCSNGLNPCQNNAKCYPVEDNDYKCICENGWTGKNCSEKVDDSKCPQGDFTCEPHRTFKGDHSPLSSLFPRALFDDECSIDNCENGICQLYSEVEIDGSMKHRSSKKMHKPKSFCQCFHGFAGPGCKMQVWIGFQNPSSYLAFRNWPAAVSNDQKNTRNVTLSLRTLGRNGVLLYHGDENAFVALELYQGRVKGTFYAGNYPPSHLYSYVMVNDGRSHRIEARIEGKTFLLKIDSLAVQAIVNSGRVEAFKTGPEHQFYIGGLPSAVAQRTLSGFHVKNATSFHGCLSNIHVNGQLKNLQTEVLSSNGTTVGCAQTIDLCIGVECGGGNGKCHLNSSLPDGFECKCRDEFDGKNCEKPKQRCIKQWKQEHVVLDDCHSVEVVKSLSCSGRCNKAMDNGRGRREDSSCCVPGRTRRKRVRLHCKNGSTRMVGINIVRKCECRASPECLDFHQKSPLPSIWII